MSGWWVEFNVTNTAKVRCVTSRALLIFEHLCITYQARADVLCPKYITTIYVIIYVYHVVRASSHLYSLPYCTAATQIINLISHYSCTTHTTKYQYTYCD